MDAPAPLRPQVPPPSTFGEWVLVGAAKAAPLVSWAAKLYSGIWALGTRWWNATVAAFGRAKKQEPLDPTKSMLMWEQRLVEVTKRRPFRLLLLGDKGVGRRSLALHFFWCSVEDFEEPAVVIRKRSDKTPPLATCLLLPGAAALDRYLRNGGADGTGDLIVLYVVPIGQDMPPSDLSRVLDLASKFRLPLALVRSKRDKAEPTTASELSFGSHLPTFATSTELPNGASGLTEWLGSLPSIDHISLMLSLMLLDAAKERLLTAFITAQCAKTPFPFEETAITLALAICGFEGDLIAELRTLIKSVRSEDRSTFSLLDEVAVCLTLLRYWKVGAENRSEDFFEIVHGEFKAYLQQCIAKEQLLPAAAAAAVHGAIALAM